MIDTLVESSDGLFIYARTVVDFILDDLSDLEHRYLLVASTLLSLDELYKDALAEGGNLIVKAGGDEKDQQDGLVQAFKKQFPGINLNLTVDLSKVNQMSSPVYSCP